MHTEVAPWVKMIASGPKPQFSFSFSAVNFFLYSTAAAVSARKVWSTQHFFLVRIYFKSNQRIFENVFFLFYYLPMNVGYYL